jgi:hypothetical protein
MYDFTLKFLLNAIFGWLMYGQFVTSPKYRTGFAILSACFLGFAGLRPRDGVPKVFMNPALNALGRAITTVPPAPKRRRRARHA